MTMIRSIVALGFMLAASAAFGQTPVRALKFADLQSYMAAQAGQHTLVVNIWATWCRPCVKELPYFEQAQQIYANKGVKVLLVSVDFADELETKVAPFVKSKNMACEVVLLDESNPNSWIDRVNKDWSGSIPVTFVVDKNGAYKAFHVGDFTPEALNQYIDKIIQQQ